MVAEALLSAGSTPFIKLYIITALLSGLAFIWLRELWGQDIPLKFHLIHFFIVVWSGIMYLNFLSESALTGYAWYLDWMISTPLILTALGLTAMYQAEDKRYDLIGALVGLQFMLVVTGIVSQSTGQVWAYWIGNGLLVGVIYILWFPLREMATETHEALGRKYTFLAGYITFFFILYPTVWYIGLPGPIGYLSAYETSVAFVVLPFMCKQAYGFIDLYLLKQAENAMD